LLNRDVERHGRWQGPSESFREPSIQVLRIESRTLERIKMMKIESNTTLQLDIKRFFNRQFTNWGSKDVLEALKAYISALDTPPKLTSDLNDGVIVDIPCEKCQGPLYLVRDENSWYDFKCRSC
jgi:hypothetical protein